MQFYERVTIKSQPPLILTASEENQFLFNVMKKGNSCGSLLTNVLREVKSYSRTVPVRGSAYTMEAGVTIRVESKAFEPQRPQFSGPAST